MKPGAELHIATDHEEYSFWIAEMMLKQEEFVSLQNEVIQSSPSLQDHVATWYETEQRRQGFEPYFMLFKRI